MKRWLFIFLTGFFGGLTVLAQSLPISKNEMRVTTDITLASKYMLDGFQVGGDHPVWQLAGKVDLYDTGFAFMAWTAIQVERSNKQFDEQDLFLLYSKDFLQDKSYTLNFHGYYDYWMFPNTDPVVDEFGETVSTSVKQGNKFQLGFSLPKLISIADSFLIPSYNAYHWLYFAQDREDLDQSGTYHELLAEYYKPTPIFIPGATYQYAGGTSSINYHEGAFDVDPGWSHSTASIVAGVYALKSIFTISLNHQWSFEETVNPENEFWSTFSYIKKF
ncbi:MAG: hypothetical protein ACAH59_12555 [Pseudobdellovibrionaceae bacterium]